MKTKLTDILTSCVVALALLLSTSAAQAADVELDGNGNVTRIENLEVILDQGGQMIFDVDFVNDTGSRIYGDPLVFPFTEEDAGNAMIQVNDALNVNDPVPMGAHSSGSDQFFIGADEDPLTGLIGAVGAEYFGDVGEWDNCKRDCAAGIAPLSPDDIHVYATFTAADAPIDPTAPTGIMASDGEYADRVHITWNAVAGATVYRTFRCTDDTTASCGSPLGFPTGTSYDDKGGVSGTVYSYRVKACTPDICGPFSVADTGYRGSEEPVAGNVSVIAAEGDELPDGTILSKIVSDGGVAINILGQVAFGGRDSDNTISVFTQNGQVAKEASTLDDDTFLEDISPFGELAINAGQSGDMVAFLGRTDKDRAVFTHTQLIVAEGDRLPDGNLVDEIRDEGKVAINDFDQVAFHGKSEVGDGVSKESFQAVFTSDEMAARESSGLDDGTTLDSIDETGGVAINDFGEVAFHGDVIDPDAGPDAVEAVFTQFGMVARREGRLFDADGTIVKDIDENGGIAINMFGEVAFHGDVLKADAGTDTVRAVFTQLNGAVAREGGTLPDGIIVDEISEIGGVAINFFGDVVFHGRTGGVKAVFSQHGLVAKEGDTLADGTILGEIHQSGGVAINFFSEVAFHGKVGASTDVVLVGQAPFLFADGEELSSE